MIKIRKGKNPESKDWSSFITLLINENGNKCIWKQDISKSRDGLFKDGSRTDDVEDADKQQGIGSFLL